MKYLTVIRTTAVIKKMAGGGGIRGRGREGRKEGKKEGREREGRRWNGEEREK